MTAVLDTQIVRGRFGDVILALPAVDFDFTNNRLHTVDVVVLARAVCIEGLRELVLVTRVHSATLGSGASIDVELVAAAPSRWQPEEAYASDDVLASVTIGASTTAGTLLRAPALPPLPTHVQLRLQVVQPVAAVTIRTRLSMDITGKR